MRKRIFAFVTALVMMLSLVSVSFAEADLPERIEIEQGSEIMPLYDYTSTYSTSLSISGGSATAKASIIGKSSVTKITIELTLQKKNLLWWKEVESHIMTYYNTAAGPSLTKAVGSGTYRTKAVYTVYSGSNSETITDYSSQKTV